MRRTALSVGLLLALALALASRDPGAAAGRARRVLLIDRSGSLLPSDPAAPERCRAGARAFGRALAPGDRLDVLWFGSGVVAAPEPPAPDALQSGTDLEGALRAALAALAPREGPADVILWTDGAATSGNALAAADAARAAGVPVHVYPVGAPPGARDAAIVRLRAPERVEAGAPFRVEATVAVTGALRGPLEVRLRGAGPERSVPLDPRPGGEATAAFDVVAGASDVELEARLAGAGLPDDLGANDQARLLVSVAGALRVVVRTGRAGGALLGLLGGVPGLEAVAGRGEEDLAGADAVILENLSREELPDREARAIARRVEEEGLGLLVAGGGPAFGPGGHAGGPLEPALPVRCEPGDRSASTFAIAVDRSGSMDDPLKQAAVEGALGTLAESLGPGDRAGLLLFADRPEWRLAVGAVDDAARRALAGPLPRAAGGTGLVAAVRAALSALSAEAPGRRRRLVLITDGEFEGDAGALGAEIQAAGAFVTVAASAQPLDAGVRRRLEALTGGGRNGRVHEVASGRGLRSVLLSERHHDLVRRELREPVRSGSAPLLEAFPGPLPAVGGWVRTAARPGAEVPARAGDDPLFATARVGAGRSAAFMADLAGPEGSAWRAAGPFWTGLARWLARGRPGPTVREEAGELRLEGAPGEAAEVVATRPEGGEQVRFVRVGRGRWSAERPAGAVERLRFEREPGLVRVRREAEVERILPGPRTGFLEELAARAGGSVLRVPEAPRPGGPPPRAALRGRPVLLGIALLLLLLGAGLGRPAAIKDRPSGVR